MWLLDITDCFYSLYLVLILTNEQFWTTAGPRLNSFRSSFVIMLIKNKSVLAGATISVCVELHMVPMSVWDSSYILKTCTLGESARLNCLHLNECEYGLMRYRERIWSPATQSWNKLVGKSRSYLFVFIFLKCVNSLHIFQCLILKVLGSFFLENWWCVFVTRNMP